MPGLLGDTILNGVGIGSVGGFNLFPVAVARRIRQTIPVSDSFVGDAAAFEALDAVATVAPA